MALMHLTLDEHGHHAGDAVRHLARHAPHGDQRLPRTAAIRPTMKVLQRLLQQRYELAQLLGYPRLRHADHRRQDDRHAAAPRS